jgi:hypothetical protein
LNELLKVGVSTTRKDGLPLAIPLKEACAAQAQTILEAHEALIQIAPANLPKFKDVIQYLKDDLHLSTRTPDTEVLKLDEPW